MKRHTGDRPVQAWVSPFIDMPADGSQSATAGLVDRKVPSRLSPELRRCTALVCEKLKTADIVMMDISFDPDDDLTLRDRPGRPSDIPFR
jgi:hypothetical protein